MGIVKDHNERLSWGHGGRWMNRWESPSDLFKILMEYHRKQMEEEEWHFGSVKNVEKQNTEQLEEKKSMLYVQHVQDV